MSLVADFRIDGDDFLLGEILARDPVAHIEMERVVPAARRIMPYVWVHGEGLEPLEASLRASEHVETLTRLDRTNGSALYRIDWADEAETLMDGIAEADATVLEARGNEEWFFRIRFDSRAGLYEFGSFCRRRGISVRLNRLLTSSSV